jgi:hypothetical protein
LAAPGSLLTEERDGFRLQWKNDGLDYPALWDAFRQGRIIGTSLNSRPRPFRAAFFVEANGRQYLFKKDWHVEKRWEKRLLYLTMGATRYSRMIQLINKAVGQGCDLVQEIYLVAEKMAGRTTCLEAWLIADYLPGRPLTREEVLEPACLAQLSQTVLAIHDAGLACNDIQPYNFLRTDDGRIKAIDVDISSPQVICQANDLYRLKALFGLDLPMRGGLGLGLVWELIKFRNSLINLSRRWRGKRPMQ